MKDEWVRVKSEDELRAGMTVEVRPCQWCGRVERGLLLHSERATPSTVGPDGSLEPAKSKVGWTVGGRCRTKPVQFWEAIRDGRLFRLVLREPEATETRAREREQVR
jgi:hypothetical protein